jgi:hypothetical protein
MIPVSGLESFILHPGDTYAIGLGHKMIFPRPDTINNDAQLC